VPTDKGYRLFVDKLSTVKPLSLAERRAIETFLEGAVDLDDVVRRSVRLLAQLTRQVAVVQYPTLSRSEVRHVEVVAMTSTRLLLVLITDRGRVEQRVVELTEPIVDDDVYDLRRILGAALNGCRLVDVPAKVADLADAAPSHLGRTLTALIAVVLESLVERPEERIVLAGTANLTRSVLDFPDTLRPVLEALEEQVVLLRLLGVSGEPDTVTVRIGAENDVEGLRMTSVLSADYGFGGVGVVGPTRMDYPANIAAVRAVARYVGELLSP
jgi:heat-inducible transcriptional repressor